LSMMDEGFVMSENARVPTSDILRRKNILPYNFKAKESISFINGTATITGILSIEVYLSIELFRSSLGSASLSFESLSGTRNAFKDWAIGARGHRGQIDVARNMMMMLHDSIICEDSEKTKVQDAYSLRCIPQVYGAVEDTIRYVKSIVDIEINSATDNPLVLDAEFVSAGNFHGEPVAFSSDFLAIALCDLGNMIERRIARLTDESLSHLPPFLIKESGLNSGYMIAQYTAAALCNRNKTLANPSSSDSIPTCANQEDHVSMGANSVIKLMELVKNLREIISIEYVLAAQALDLTGMNPCIYNKLMRNIIRESVPFLDADRPVFQDLERMNAILDGSDDYGKLMATIKIDV
ncbi:MAG: aromatic amino acid lyase, partial [Thermoplasmataceae archaeon]